NNSARLLLTCLTIDKYLEFEPWGLRDLSESSSAASCCVSLPSDSILFTEGKLSGVDCRRIQRVRVRSRRATVFRHPPYPIEARWQARRSEVSKSILIRTDYGGSQAFTCFASQRENIGKIAHCQLQFRF